MAAVATVGATPRNMGLPAEAEAAVSAGTGLDEDARTVEHTPIVGDGERSCPFGFSLD